MNEATRQVLWNVDHPATEFIMYSLLLLSLVVGATGVIRHAELWCAGKPDPSRFGRWGHRFLTLWREAIGQQGVLRRPAPALYHTLIYLGFLVLLFTTTMVFIDHDLGIQIYQGDFYLAVTLLSDIFGMGVLFGCILAAHRRYIRKSDALHNRFADSSMLFILALLIVQGFILEGLRIQVTADAWARYSPVGLLVAKFFWSLSEDAARLLHAITWWFHTVTVFGLLALFPYSKYFHVLASSLNLYFKEGERAPGALSFPGDISAKIESGEEFSIGLGTIKDYSWKQLLDLDACTSCGRCQNACPAYLSEKALSPKWIILDTRNHVLALHSKREISQSILPKPLVELDQKLMNGFFLPSSGLRNTEAGYEGSGEFRSKNKLVQEAVRKIGQSAEDRISGDVIDADAFWACTTCMACVEACPVGINPMEQIVENRRNMVLMQGEIPPEAQKTLRSIESRGNPYGDQKERIKWLEGLNVRILQPGDEVDYLYWVGCVSSYDPRKQKIARALATIMNHANLSFGILGSAEGCSGDPARRLGEENLYQLMAKSNLETLKSVKFKVLVANCPHCFNTIKNEYPQLGNLGNGEQPEIIHHSALLKKLLAENRLTLKEGAPTTFTFHDPCYLGRYNGEYDAPRDTLSKIGSLKIVEMDRSRENGMCCGAGGGHFWFDMKVGKRINVLRVDQAAETEAQGIATACPFCMQMLEDGVKLTDRELPVKDLAELIAEHLV